MQLSNAASERDCNNLRCVIDPLLALSTDGVSIIQDLASLTEVWMARELWYILNNVNFYINQPGLLNPSIISPQHQPEQEHQMLQATRLSLKQWELLLRQAELSRLNLFWFGDSLQESCRPEVTDDRLFEFWEALAHSFDLYLAQIHVKEHILSLAIRDTIALTNCLNSAFILTRLDYPSCECNVPLICKILDTYQIPCRSLTNNDLDLIPNHIHKATQKLALNLNQKNNSWSQLKLAVLYILVPNLANVKALSSLSQYEQTSSIESSSFNLGFTQYIWSGMQGIWYSL
jgi:hypothetical protein